MTTSEYTTPQAELFDRIAKDLSLRTEQVTRTVGLLLDEATVPFIARYRKEATENLDEEQIRQVAERHKYYQELEQRRATILHTIASQDKLTDALRQQIITCFDKTELEDLYLPYRPKRQTKASVAIERGLEPLARLFWEQQPTKQSYEEMAAAFIDVEKGVTSLAEALSGAGHIVAEWIAEHADLRRALRTLILSEGMVRATVVQGKQGEKTKFQDYYDFRERVATIPSHRILAILRGVREDVLSMTIDIERDKALGIIQQQIIRQADSMFAPWLWEQCEDAYERLLLPSLQNEVRRALKARADTEAMGVFQDNLRSLLMAPPLGAFGILGLDPGLRTGCKLAVVDDTGKFLEHGTIYPLLPKADIASAEQTLSALIARHSIRAIAVGNGTGSREAETFVRRFIDKHAWQDKVLCVVVNEAGASVYSASKLARQEFPELDVTVRGAISIARRLQDPLAELVKIDPKSIGVGQYQHDVDQKLLRRSLGETVESCVNRVGVDVNTASTELLQFVSGLNMGQARNLVEYRNTHGRFHMRQEFLQVTGLGEKTFQQAAGFLRIKDGANTLDTTAVHPESYEVVERMATSLAVPVADLVANAELVAALDLQQFVDEHVGLYTLQDIREELLKPGRDPRQEFVMPHFRADVTTLADLQENMILEGIVSNVTNFGAFVDIGVHQDGLVHISELSHRYIRDPREVVHVGQIVQVKVLGVDVSLQRISLSMKAVQSAAPPSPEARQRPARPPRRKRKKLPTPKIEPAVATETVLAEKLRALQDHFHGSNRH
jgi:protein Tex